ncbi:VWA domain-containing protein [bacterium]|nr:VWA domain-containing protein [bacterium]
MKKVIPYVFLFLVLLLPQKILAQATCGSAHGDIVLMLDRTGSMGAQDRTREMQAAQHFVDLVASTQSGIGIAVGRFGDGEPGTPAGGTAAEIFLSLTTASPGSAQSIKDAIADALDNASPGSSNLEDAIEVATRHLVLNANSGMKTIILISDGVPNTHDSDAEDAAEVVPFRTSGSTPKRAAYNAAFWAKNTHGIRIITISFGSSGSAGGPYRELMAQMASNGSDDDTIGGVSDGELIQENGDGDDFFVAVDSSNFSSIFTSISGSILCDDADTCSQDLCDFGTNHCVSVAPDADSDGANDCRDNCPSDAGKTEPGICGCGVSDQADADGDSTPDCIDECVSDPGKIIPGICGCGVSDADSDGDDVVDCQDLCPVDPATSGDTDGDGTADCNDMCVDDPAKTQPGQCGCGSTDIDSDGDGVADCIDLCVNDPGKTSPGVCGCNSIDEDIDSDGTPNCIDQCPLNPDKIAPGGCGCDQPDIDTDGDGIYGCRDLCPDDPSKGDPLKNGPGVCGCSIPDTNSDGDDAVDCRDACPNDPTKIEAGVCDCGVSDVDSDQDGTADCLDLCNADPLKTEPGVCGCGTSDLDSDGDDKVDCEDLCANDQNKTEPGVCGCGVADTDTDGDGSANCIDQCPNDATKASPGVCGCGIAEGTCPSDSQNPDNPDSQNPDTGGGDGSDQAPVAAAAPAAPFSQVQGSGASCSLNAGTSSNAMSFALMMILLMASFGLKKLSIKK